MPKPLPQPLHHLPPHTPLLVKPLKLLPLLIARVAPDGGDVDHPVPELDERPPLDGDVEVGDVVQDKLDEVFVVVLADVLDEGVGGEGLAELEGGEAVFGEAKVEEGGYGHAEGVAELFLLLGEVGAADEADGDFLAELGEEEEDFGGGVLLRF